jgi:shikimate dehydrogenase
MPNPTAATRVAGVVGWPIEHSLSPTIHNAAYRALGLDWSYVAFPVTPEDFPAAIEGLRAAGLAGVNVTLPHKEAAAAAATALSEDAERLRAANVLTFAGEIAGDNTDCLGFSRFLADDPGVDPAGRSALLFGAGGAGRACALALARGGLDHLAVAVREPARAAALRSALEGLPTRVELVELGADLSPFDLVVNATPVGQGGESLPLPGLHAGQIVVDLIYRPALTPLVEEARAAGAQAYGGLGLLLHQAALTIERWTGQVAPLSVMSAAALAELAEDPKQGFETESPRSMLTIAPEGPLA